MRIWISLAVFLALWIHGALLGLSDDEAYYWVLAQNPALGYAFHPPMVAWLIRAFQVLEGVFGNHSPALVRLPAAISSGFLVFLSLRWMSELGMEGRSEKKAAAILLSFSGLFALSWMTVPDIPLFLGWTILFTQTWEISFKKGKAFNYLSLGGAATLCLLSKYSAVLALFSVFVSLVLFAGPRERKKGIAALFLGTVLGALPILIWNSEHQWVSILYQIRDRHGSDWSWVRYLRFWATQLVLAGPLGVVYTLYILKRSSDASKGNSEDSLFRYVAVWILPAFLVFCTQPLWTDFKAHWAFIVWWPGILVLAWMSSQKKNWKVFRVQAIYGGFLTGLVLLSCHFPVVSWLENRFVSSPFDPRWDATNDLYGWQGFREYFVKARRAGDEALPVVGSRYQTASQAAFSLNGIAKVTLLPRSDREKEDWTDLGISEKSGPEWPRLTHAIFYVNDNRFDAPPEFPGAKCLFEGKFEESRAGLRAKRIDLWRCDQLN